VGDSSSLSDSAKRDLILASIAIKYTQSNSVGYAINGQMIGVGAGQQSRVDCVKLASRKVSIWQLRQHSKVQNLPFKSTVKRQDRVNARVRYIEGDITAAEMPIWLSNFVSVPEPLSAEEKDSFVASLSGVAISSDAFFPFRLFLLICYCDFLFTFSSFRDSIDHASKVGVSYVAQPGGSIADAEVFILNMLSTNNVFHNSLFFQVITACKEYGMSMCFTDLRLFHH
jgi:phosphoribosylaminoimidazolecarboxamide formyltransferase/IMP cyclohydrolase